MILGEIKKRRGKRLLSGAVCLLAIAGLILSAGCSEPETKKAQLFLIKTPSMIITSSEFLEELDLKKAAYPYNIHEDPEAYNEMVIDLVKMLSEEIILLSAAADKGVIVTDQEVAAAEKKFKADYPENSFDQILLENAISYSFWKTRFKKNMIMEKLIDQELKKKIVITSDDIVSFYKDHRTSDVQDKADNGTVLKKIQSEKELVYRLRNQKTQDHYDEWIQQLGKAYPVEIDTEKLKKFLIDIETSKGSKNEKEN